MVWARVTSASDLTLFLFLVFSTQARETLIVTAAIVRTRNRMNNDIQIIVCMPSEDDPAGCCPSAWWGDEFMHTLVVTVNAQGIHVGEMVTTVLMVAVSVTVTVRKRCSLFLYTSYNIVISYFSQF